MGGNVGVIIKQENGEQIGMDRWTNVMPHFFTSIDLYKGNTKQWYEDFSKQWLVMKNDYEENKDTGNFKENMTSVYFPHDTLSPSEYGIIAVDMQNKKIYSSQDYCNIGSLSLYKLWSRHPDQLQENVDVLKKYINNDMLKELSYYRSETEDFGFLDISHLTLNEMITFLDEAFNGKLEKFSLPLLANINKKDFSIYSETITLNTDWNFFIENDRSLGILKVKKEMESDGFIFNEKDNQAWKKYLSKSFYGANEEDLKDNKYFQEFATLYKVMFKEDFVIIKEEINKPKI